MIYQRSGKKSLRISKHKPIKLLHRFLNIMLLKFSPIRTMFYNAYCIFVYLCYSLVISSLALAKILFEAAPTSISNCPGSTFQSSVSASQNAKSLSVNVK